MSDNQTVVEKVRLTFYKHLTRSMMQAGQLPAFLHDPRHVNAALKSDALDTPYSDSSSPYRDPTDDR